MCADISAPIEDVFAFVADYRNALQYMAHFHTFQPTSSNTIGLGARVLARGQLHGFPISTELEIVGFEQNRRLVSVSRRGLRSSSEWLFEPREGGCRVTFTAEYELPRLPLRGLIGKLVAEEIKAGTRRTLGNLKRIMEQKNTKG